VLTKIKFKATVKVIKSKGAYNCIKEEKLMIFYITRYFLRSLILLIYHLTDKL